MKKVLAIALALVMAMSLCACGGSDPKKVTIYHCISATRADPIQESIRKAFPDYEIVFEYMGLSELAAKLKNEGTDTDIDIALDLGYVYLEDMKDLWEDHSKWDTSQFKDFMQVEGKAWMPWSMYSGCVCVNKDVLTAKGLDIPTSWEDLKDPQYKGMIQMPNPASSGTGYIFLKMLCELWGTDKAIAYFDELAANGNILQFTDSGSAPLSALVAQECGIALCMTYQAANKITEGVNLEILAFDGGYPWTNDGAAIVKGHENESVDAVFKYLYDTAIIEDMALFTEHGFVEGDGQLENFPQDIVYSEMGTDTLAAKQEILNKWTH